MTTFRYKNVVPIIQWGCSFDSLLELKYAIFIHDEYDFLRAHIPIYYDPKTKMPTDYIRGNTRRYTPDFLIRHKQTREAFLVELKPRAFAETDQWQLQLRKEVAEKYIEWKKRDWKFIVVFDDGIRLNERQQKMYWECCGMIRVSGKKMSFQKLNNRFDDSRPTFFKSAVSPSVIQFVMLGTTRKIS